MIKKVIYLTHTRPAYSLNSALIKGLRENGTEVVMLRIVGRGILGFAKSVSFCWRNSKNTDAVIIGYDSPVLAIFIRPFCHKKIIYNAVLSGYERMIVSRKLAPKFSIKSAYYWLKDFVASHCADLILVESDLQADYFAKLFRVSKNKIYTNYIGVDQDNFFHDSSIDKFPTFTVVFRGALMPEAGAEYVIQAAKILEKESVKFIMLGGGLLLTEISRLINEVNPSNLEFRPALLSVEELRTLMQKCHLSLGQLSNHPRLGRTIPHKLYESLVMRLPYLTASNAGALELLGEGKTCITCKPADARSVAEKILWAKGNFQELEKVAQNGYKLYQNKLRSHILARNLLEKIIEL